jgi:thiopurine S-methyltransferase
MEISYWQSRWQKNNIGWHMDIVYPPLPRLLPQLSLKSQSRVLVPLCGRSLDMKWLSEQNHYVIGVEVSQKALQEFIESCDQAFVSDSSHGFTIYRSPSIELWQGDFLKVPENVIKPLDAIYDKAAIVALPENLRPDYAQKLLDLCHEHSQILLQTFVYKQNEMNGPPFSVDEEEINRLFGHRFSITLLHERSLFDELSKFQRRGLSSYLIEKVFHLG